MLLHAMLLLPALAGLLAPRVRSAQKVLLYVDVPSTNEGAEAAAVLAALDAFSSVRCVYVWSAPTVALLSEQGVEGLSETRVPDAGDEHAWAATLGDGEICGVICGSDAGLAAAERLQHVLVPSRSNGILLARRDKYLMNEALRAAGLAVAAQAAPATWEEAASFLERLRAERGADGFRAVLKPRRGTASVGVFLVSGLDEARGIFEVLSERAVSSDASEIESGCVVQECLDGDEWSERGTRRV
jgi:hypothetical protein